MKPQLRTHSVGLLLLSMALCAPPSVWAGSETPPEGPPWERELAAAQTAALKRGVPIFVYLTKTYCPHCVKLEKAVLGKKDIAPIYDKAVWLYVYRDFSGSEADRAAERVALRLGFSSYPQHHLLHPVTLKRLGTPPRSIEGFINTFSKADVGEIGTVDAPGALAAAEVRAARLETKRSVKDALRAIDADEDIVVRFRAVQILAEKKPAELVTRCKDLMEVPNDLLRYEVCKVVKEHGDAACAPVFEATARRASNSMNPNVLRIRAVEVLGAIGGSGSIEIIAPFAQGPWNNGLTRISVTALGQIGMRHKRDKALKRVVRDALVAAFPAPPKEADGDRAARAVISIAKHVHATLERLTERGRPFPDAYDEEAVARLRASWK